METVAPSGITYAHVSQKMLKGAAARFIIFWLASLTHTTALGPEATQADKCLVDTSVMELLHTFAVSLKLQNVNMSKSLRIMTDNPCVWVMRHKANLFLALTSIHSTLAAHGYFDALKISRYCSYHVVKLLVIFLL